MSRLVRESDYLFPGEEIIRSINNPSVFIVTPDDPRIFGAINNSHCSLTISDYCKLYNYCNKSSLSNKAIIEKLFPVEYTEE